MLLRVSDLHSAETPSRGSRCHHLRGVSGAARTGQILIAAASRVIVTLLSSFLVVALAEMGDKTQLVALSMASRYRPPWAVLLGILIATTINHALASSVGVWAANRIPAAAVQWLLALRFIGFALSTLF